MSVSVADLAKQLDIAPEAVLLHAMDLDFEIPEDEMVPDDIVGKIRDLELGDEIAQTEHEIEDQMEKEIVEKQQERTAGSQKKIAKKQQVKEKKEKEKLEERPDVEVEKTDDGTIILPESMTVRQLAIKISKPIPLVLIKLKANGIVANLKEEIDYDTAGIVAEELGVKVRREAAQLSGEDLFRGDLSTLLADEDPEHLIPRPPVVSIMGHVDHGKTSILDSIRKAKVAEGEAGGITQSIGAYQVETSHGLITFLDTPGHEAFTMMRARGARATDIAILVVAASEGLKPQSIEAINHAKEAEIPIIVAINKMDLPDANPDLVKGQLAEHDLTPEDWQGSTPCVEVSAKTGKGLDQLLDTIHIAAELQNLKANPDRPALGTIIESEMNPKSGISATVLVNTGTLNQGDPFVIFNQNGKVRVMLDHTGKALKKALPSMPVQITGLSSLPKVGDLLQVMESDKLARKQAEEVASIHHEDELTKRKRFSLAAIKAKLAREKMGQLKVIVKAESQGALEAVVGEIEKVKTDEAFAKVVHSGVGDISESDVMLGKAGLAVVVGFHIDVPSRIQKIADKEGVEVYTFDVIYHLTEKIQDILLGKIEDEETETIFGSLNVKGVFASNKKMAVVGGAVESGKMRHKTMFRQFRMGVNEETEEKEEQLVGQGKIDSVQLGQKDVAEVNEGTECGLRITHSGLTFEVGDRIESFVVKK